MKACSFLPAATQMIYDMNLQHLLHGVTFECPSLSRKEKAIIVHCVLEGKQYSSKEIDKIFSAGKAQGKSLYYVDEPLLQKLQPSIIFTQDVCEVCQIDTACTAAAVSKLEYKPQLIALTPNTLKDVFQTAVIIAEALGEEEAAYTYLSALQKRMDSITDQLRKHKSPLKSVMLMEWMEPMYNCGHWIPYQVAYAGGVDMLSNPGGDSIVTSWEKMLKYDPEILVIAPCGFDSQRTIKELSLLTGKTGWAHLKAVKNQSVFIADYDLFTQPTPGSLVQGIELLAALIHPEIFDMPGCLQHKFISLSQLQNNYVQA